jgi:two-component system chemotaxis response regulator CheY
LARTFIISDNLLIRTLLREILADGGHNVIGDAVNRPTTMTRVLESRPDVVILDVVLLRAPGLTTLRELRTIDRRIAVIICAAALERNNAIAALRIGAKGFIVKPFARERVLRSVEDAVSQVGKVAAADELETAAATAAEPAAAGTGEQRGFARVAAALGVGLTDEDGTHHETTTVDISAGGMLLAAGALPIGMSVDFELDLGTGEHPITGRARVARVSADGQPALAFEEVHVADHERLNSYIAGIVRSGSGIP